MYGTLDASSNVESALPGLGAGIDVPLGTTIGCWPYARNSLLGATGIGGLRAGFAADGLTYSWWVYQEAGTYAGRVQIDGAHLSKATVAIPSGADGKQIHVILEVRDDSGVAELSDYRRVVVDVEGIACEGGTRRASDGLSPNDA